MSVHLLKLTIGSLENNNSLTQECREWLLSGLTRYYLKGNGLEEFLGLRVRVPPGGSHLQPLRVDRLGSRNKLIQDLADGIPGNSALEQSKILEVMFRRYPMMADEYGPVTEKLIRQLMADHQGSVPKSVKQIQRILQRESIPCLSSQGHRFRVCVPDPFKGKFPPTQIK